jgi:hypothetical protein
VRLAHRCREHLARPHHPTVPLATVKVVEDGRRVSIFQSCEAEFGHLGGQPVSGPSLQEATRRSPDPDALVGRAEQLVTLLDVEDRVVLGQVADDAVGAELIRAVRVAQ